MLGDISYLFALMRAPDMYGAIATARPNGIVCMHSKQAVYFFVILMCLHLCHTFSLLLSLFDISRICKR